MLSPREIHALPDSLVNLFSELDEALVAEAAKLHARGSSVSTIASRLEAIGASYTLRIQQESARVVTRGVTTASNRLEPALERAANAGLVRKVADTVTARVTATTVRQAASEALTLKSRALEARISTVRDAIEAGARNLTGGMARDKAVAQAVFDIGDSASKFTYGGRSIELESAVRQTIGTMAHRAIGEIAYQRGIEVGAQQVYVTQHMGARPEHAEWQGQTYGFPDELEEATGYPSDELGLMGINCRHSYYFTFEDDAGSFPEPIDQDENEAVYEATQRQRACERNIRKYKRRLAGSDSALSELDSPVLLAQRDRDSALVRKWQAEARQNAKANDLTRRYASEK